MRLTVWRFKLKGNFLIKRVKFIGCGFESSLLFYHQIEIGASWIFSAHINLEVVTSLTVLARLLDGELSYVKAKWVTMSGVQIPAKTLAKFFDSTVYGTSLNTL